MAIHLAVQCAAKPVTFQQQQHRLMAGLSSVSCAASLTAGRCSQLFQAGLLQAGSFQSP
jgi:hypothetical protein